VSEYVVIHDGPQGDGSGDSIANGMSLQAAADTAVAGDTVSICATGAYAYGSPIDFDTNSGTQSQPIVFRGRDATNAADAQVTLGSSAGGNAIDINSRSWLLFRKLTVVESVGAARCWFIDKGDGIVLVGCKGTGGSDGVRNDSSAYDNKLIDCEMYGNTRGAYVSSLASLAILGGSYHDNSGNGIYANNASVTVTFAQVYDNGGDGIAIAGADSGHRVIQNCTINGNDGDGVQLANDLDLYFPVLLSNSVTRNGGYAVNGAAAVQVVAAGNFWPSAGDDANTSGALNNVTLTAGDALAANLTTGSALYTSVADGAEDFTPQSGSDLLNAGYPAYVDIGAVQKEAVTPSVPSTPTLAVSNDGDGDAVTATVAGEAGATHTLYYRKSGVEAWTAGSSRVGDGDIAQAGLDATTFYVFEVISSIGGSYSLHSGAVTVYTASSDLCVLENIAAALEAKLLELVATGAASLVERPLRGGVPTSPKDKALYVFQDDPELDEESPIGFTTWFQPFLVVCCIVPPDGATDAVDTQVNEIRAQVEEKLRQDPTLGGLARDTRIGPPVNFNAAQGGFSGTVVAAVVRYWHREDDPYLQS